MTAPARELPAGFVTETYRIWPYARQAGYPRDLLYILYKAMEEAGDLERVFYEMDSHELEKVLSYFLSTVLFLVSDPTLGRCLGAVWFTDLTKYKANIGIWFAPEARGALSRDASMAIVQVMFEDYRVEQILGFTPWKNVVQYGKDCGFTLAATFEDAVIMHSGMHRPLYVLRRKRSDACPRPVGNTAVKTR